MKVPKKHKKVQANGTELDKSVRLEMNIRLWNQLTAVAEDEGRKQGRPKSVSAVMRKMLQAGVEARTK